MLGRHFVAAAIGICKITTGNSYEPVMYKNMRHRCAFSFSTRVPIQSAKANPVNVWLRFSSAHQGTSHCLPDVVEPQETTNEIEQLTGNNL